jgi:hypothetical protein
VAENNPVFALEDLCTLPGRTSSFDAFTKLGAARKINAHNLVGRICNPSVQVRTDCKSVLQGDRAPIYVGRLSIS